MGFNYYSFYKKNSRRFKKCAFISKARLIRGKKPNFFNLLRNYSDRRFRVLDLGCGSGELTLKLSPYFGEIIGIDLFDEYIKTARENQKLKRISNVIFEKGNGDKLSFGSSYFDIVYSSRGPLSSSRNFISESARVLKQKGFLIEETIGEKDKLELKKVFKRGQNYPFIKTKLEQVKQMLRGKGLKLLMSKQYFYYEIYSSIDEIIDLLERAPIITDFSRRKDTDIIKRINQKILKQNGIILSSHRVHWIARK